MAEEPIKLHRVRRASTDLISMLADLLSAARSGDIHQVAFIATTTDDYYQVGVSKAPGPRDHALTQMAAGVAELQLFFARQLLDG